MVLQLVATDHQVLSFGFSLRLHRWLLEDGAPPSHEGVVDAAGELDRAAGAPPPVCSSVRPTEQQEGGPAACT